MRKLFWSNNIEIVYTFLMGQNLHPLEIEHFLPHLLIRWDDNLSCDSNKDYQLPLFIDMYYVPSVSSIWPAGTGLYLDLAPLYRQDASFSLHSISPLCVFSILSHDFCHLFHLHDN